MSDGQGPTCFGCGEPVADAPGTYYCPACIVEQLAEASRERQAFEDFHRFADSVGTDRRGKGSA